MFHVIFIASVDFGHLWLYENLFPIYHNEWHHAWISWYTERGSFKNYATQSFWTLPHCNLLIHTPEYQGLQYANVKSFALSNFWMNPKESINKCLLFYDIPKRAVSIVWKEKYYSMLFSWITIYFRTAFIGSTCKMAAYGNDSNIYNSQWSSRFISWKPPQKYKIVKTAMNN